MSGGKSFLGDESTSSEGSTFRSPSLRPNETDYALTFVRSVSQRSRSNNSPLSTVRRQDSVQKETTPRASSAGPSHGRRIQDQFSGNNSQERSAQSVNPPFYTASFEETSSTDLSTAGNARRSRRPRRSVKNRPTLLAKNRESAPKAGSRRSTKQSRESRPSSTPIEPAPGSSQGRKGPSATPSISSISVTVDREERPQPVEANKRRKQLQPKKKIAWTAAVQEIRKLQHSTSELALYC